MNALQLESTPYMSRIANNALLGGGVRVRVWIREQRKIKRRAKVLLSLCWQSLTSLVHTGHSLICYGIMHKKFLGLIEKYNLCGKLNL